MILALEKELPPEGTPITMNEAARAYGVVPQTIVNGVRYGWVRVLDQGKGQGSPRLVVDEHDVAKMIAQGPKRPGPSPGSSLTQPEGTPITMSEAARAYGVVPQTIVNWVRYGWVRVLDQGKGQGSPRLVDEHDVAKVIAQGPKRPGPSPGSSLTQPEGTPITMSEAARAYGVVPQTIVNWVRYGWVRVLDQGKGQGSPRLVVDEHDVAKMIAQGPKRPGPSLGSSLTQPEGTPITMSEAARAYGVVPQTIVNWVRYGWVRVLDQGKGQGSPRLVDEHDVAKVIAQGPKRPGPSLGSSLKRS